MICKHWTLNTPVSCHTRGVLWVLVRVEGTPHSLTPLTAHSWIEGWEAYFPGCLIILIWDCFPDKLLIVVSITAPVWQLLTAGQWAPQQPNKTHVQRKIEGTTVLHCPTRSYTGFWKILKYCVARKNLFFNFLFLKVWEPGEVRYLLEIWIDQLNHLPGLNRCWFFLAFLVVLRPPWLITWPPGVPANSSVRLQTEFQCSMQEFSWLNFVSQTNLCCVGEIYWREREECGQDLQWNVLISSHWSRASRRAE